MTSFSRHLAELRAPDFDRLVTDRSIFVQPLGAVEQHGPHLPFNTDLLIADRVATTAVERVGDELDVWLLPPLAYTKSNEHAWSSGTIWLSATTLLAVLDDIGRCVAMTDARKLVFMNGHGGNSALVGVANREIRLSHGLMTFLTEITSNTATTNVILPVLARAAVEGGLNPLVLMAPVTVAASAAFMLPVATPPNAVVFSSGRISIATMARVGLVLNFVSIGLITLVFQLWVRHFWDLSAGLPPWATP